MAANTRTLNDQELAYVLQQYPLPNVTAKAIADHLTAERGDERPPVTESQVFSSVKRVRKALQAALEVEQTEGNLDEVERLHASLARLAPHQKAVQRRAQMRSLVQGVLSEG